MTNLNRMPDDPEALYLDLMKRCLTSSIYPDTDGKPWPKRFFWRTLLKLVLPKQVRLYQMISGGQRAKGQYWPTQAHTMIGFQRLDNLQFCVEDVLAKGVPGDLMETGVWRGGATVLMRAILRAHRVKDRRVWVADSFEGLPKPDSKNYSADAWDHHYLIPELAVSLEQVQTHFKLYGLLDDQVRFLKGWFRDTLPTAPIERLAVLRLDGDLYESTMDAFVHLYSKLSVGGYVIVDDYHPTPACRKAVHDFRAAHQIQEEIREIDGMGVFWQRRGSGL